MKLSGYVKKIGKANITGTPLNSKVECMNTCPNPLHLPENAKN